MFIVLNMYLDHLKLCVVCVNGRMYGCCSYDDICKCVVNEHFELIEFVFHYVYVDLKYNEVKYMW